MNDPATIQLKVDERAREQLPIGTLFWLQDDQTMTKCAIIGFIDDATVEFIPVGEPIVLNKNGTAIGKQTDDWQT